MVAQVPRLNLLREEKIRFRWRWILRIKLIHWQEKKPLQELWMLSRSIFNVRWIWLACFEVLIYLKFNCHCLLANEVISPHYFDQMSQSSLKSFILNFFFFFKILGTIHQSDIINVVSFQVANGNSDDESIWFEWWLIDWEVLFPDLVNIVTHKSRNLTHFVLICQIWLLIWYQRCSSEAGECLWLTQWEKL